jgi:hypothetical protein
VWRGGEIHKGFWWRYPKKRERLEDLRVDGKLTLKLILKEWDGRLWTGFIWIRLEANNLLL